MLLLLLLYFIVIIKSIDNNNATIILKKVSPPNKNDLLKKFSSSTTSTSQKKMKFLIWFSNNDGIFSQFLQMKIMHYVAQNINKRTLLIAPIRSLHMPNQTIILCDLFQLPITIQCFNNDDIYNWNYYNKDIKCLTDIKVNIMLKSNSYSNNIEKHDIVCYRGLVPFLGTLTRRDAVLNAVDFAIPNLILNKIYRESFLTFKKNLGFNNNNYTVIHWRRGDQLSSRCKQGRDLSVNCNDASYLISFVHSHVQDKLVYIATNEKNAINELHLLTNAGFLIYNHSYSIGTNDDLSIFMLEIALMLDSTTFLGWGISEVNDVIENQRMRMKKSYCKSNENLLEEIVFPTWCANRNKTIYSSHFNDAPISNPHSHSHGITNVNSNQHIHTIGNHNNGTKTGGHLRQVLHNITTARIKQHNHQQHQQHNKNDKDNKVHSQK